ncbi:hypothetical protein PMIN07_012414 [Paraphaeosphaeria minitans]
MVAHTKEKLPTTFQCLFCNHENSVSVSIEKKSGVGNLQCKVCGQTFQTNTNCTSRFHPSCSPWTILQAVGAALIATGRAALIQSSQLVEGGGARAYCSTDLSAPVDVYSDWVDACDAVAKEAAAANTSISRPVNRGGRSRVEEETEDFVVQDDADAEGEYDDY